VQEMLNDDLSVCTSIGLQEASAIMQDMYKIKAKAGIS